jgi:hypothetical protein
VISATSTATYYIDLSPKTSAAARDHLDSDAARCGAGLLGAAERLSFANYQTTLKPTEALGCFTWMDPIVT